MVLGLMVVGVVMVVVVVMKVVCRGRGRSSSDIVVVDGGDEVRF